MPEIRTASIGVWVNVGARYEKREENGIAHFLEHLAFKGTKTRNALEIAEKIVKDQLSSNDKQKALVDALVKDVNLN